MTKSPPAHWVQQTGPCQWFQFWHPPGWQLETTGNGFDLTAPDGGGVLSLVASWDLRPSDAPLPSVMALAAALRNTWAGACGAAGQQSMMRKHGQAAVVADYA